MFVTAIPRARRGTVDHRPAELVDVLPTILQAAGQPRIAGKPGEDLLGPSARRASFCEFNDQPGTVSFMWRTERRKLILTFPKEAIQDGAVPRERVKAGEFYDLRVDPQEWNNLYDRAERRAERERMTAELFAHLNGGALRKLAPAAGGGSE